MDRDEIDWAIFKSVVLIFVIIVILLLQIGWLLIEETQPTQINSPGDRLESIEVRGKSFCVDSANEDFLWSRVKGVSMSPTIAEGHHIISVLVPDKDDIKLGDIITINRTNEDLNVSTITHRVVDIGEDKEGKYFITKGDNNLHKDEKVRVDEVLSVVVSIIY